MGTRERKQPIKNRIINYLKSNKILCILIAIIFGLTAYDCSRIHALETQNADSDSLVGLEGRIHALESQVEWQETLADKIDEMNIDISEMKDELSEMKDQLEEPKEYKYVRHLYRQLLKVDSNIDPIGLSAWSDRLINGTYSGEEIFYKFIGSEQFQEMYREDDRGFLEAVYQASMGEKPNEVDIEGYLPLSEENNEEERLNLVKKFLHKPQFAEMCKDWNVKPYSEEQS